MTHHPRQCRIAALALWTLVAAAVPAVAHHSFAAQYDRTKAHSITGPLTRIEWRNPHIYLHMTVKDAAGKETEWAIEGAAPNQLYRQGWRKDTLAIGEIVTIEGWLARDGSPLLNMSLVRTADGRRVFGGQAQQ